MFDESNGIFSNSNLKCNGFFCQSFHAWLEKVNKVVESRNRKIIFNKLSTNQRVIYRKKLVIDGGGS